MTQDDAVTQDEMVGPAVAVAGDERATGAKVVARRRLGGPGTAPPGWRFTSLADMGRDSFVRVLLAVSEGDPYDTSTSETADSDFEELVDAAGALFDPACWFVVADADGDIGVVLPQPFPDHPSTGTLLYLGVLPARRGEGLGASLHRWGLGELWRRGVRSYVGSTGATNGPMVAIFTANGCELD